ncbi:dTDP-4-dehydrorhamnose reductase [Akkermansiaceae bacterium]|nr:dTDP-4-dehydrorhamnose reductase [Akkermansiaceae bacterium]
MNILITGSNGQLGSEVKALAVNYPEFNFFFRDFIELDICNSSQLDTFFKAENINTVINCAAYTKVEKAEENIEISRKVNSTGVSNLINSLEKVSGKLVHISTDYVFDGNSFSPYQETDPVNPIGVYGKTKREGEMAVLKSELDAIVIRTSWLYSSFGENFVKTMLRLGEKKEEMGVIFDQVGTPTYAKDLAKTCLDILVDKNLDGISAKGKIYHFSNEGVASWYDFAKAIMELAGLNRQINPIQTKDFPSSVKRPHFSVLNKSKIKTDFDVEIPYWRDSLNACISILNKNKKL